MRSTHLRSNTLAESLSKHNIICEHNNVCRTLRTFLQLSVPTTRTNKTSNKETHDYMGCPMPEKSMWYQNYKTKLGSSSPGMGNTGVRHPLLQMPLLTAMLQAIQAVLGRPKAISDLISLGGGAPEEMGLRLPWSIHEFL